MSCIVDEWFRDDIVDLVVQGKVAEAKATLIFIFRWNRLPLDAHVDEQLCRMSDALVAEEQLETAYTWLDCFRTPVMRKLTLCQSFMWCAAQTSLTITFSLSLPKQKQ